MWLDGHIYVHMLKFGGSCDVNMSTSTTACPPTVKLQAIQLLPYFHSTLQYINKDNLLSHLSPFSPQMTTVRHYIYSNIHVCTYVDYY